jgi:hypothetical protein
MTIVEFSGKSNNKKRKSHFFLFSRFFSLLALTLGQNYRITFRLWKQEILVSFLGVVAGS